ncbi:predicted protein [Chaetoceros tenuissimus]|uniref:Uncharacterized protein n=1 Tax=Chaetoceros tenuissimus TaxID=426638 RepID=A0AAD3D604_9STRA|nr:predicted protein [Chaetoceros tenuissimus]
MKFITSAVFLLASAAQGTELGNTPEKEIEEVVLKITEYGTDSLVLTPNSDQTLNEDVLVVDETDTDDISRQAPINIDGLNPGAKLCNVVPTVTCRVKATGQDCENLIISKDQCRPMDMNFTFKYCNKEDREVEIFPGTGPNKTKAVIDTIPVAGINANPVKPGQCRELTVTRSIDTCRKFYSASFEFNGRRGLDWRNGDYCYGFDFLRVFIKRPCALTSDVSNCIMLGQDCRDVMIPLDECNEKEPAEMEFSFCNKEKTPVKVRKQKFNALVETLPVDGFDLSDIPPKTCRTVPVIKEINTCKRFFSRRLNIEGWKESGTGDYCNGYDFERVYFRRPMDPDPPKYDSPCKVTSQVKCKIAGTNTDCDDIVVPLSECEEDKEMTFEFEYCNLEESGFVDLDFRSNARVETSFVRDLDISILAPGECRTHRETRKINTCKRFFSARLNIEGRRDSAVGDYCGAFDFYRSYIKRPASDDGFLADECDIRSKVSCTIEETGEDCGDIVVPLSDCNEKTPMLFTFEYCNGEDESAIDLRPEGSVARVETIDIEGLNFSDMAPKECRRLIRRREINTCKRFFSARLGVEGKRTEDGVYCYAWDFYREYIARFKKPSLPAPPGGDDGPCAITSKVSCTFDATGQACEDVVIPFSECEESAPATFIYEYCNFNDSEDIEFKVSNTRALIETDNVTSEFNLSNLDAGSCRRRVVRYNINTCKRFISARLNIEGWRGGDRNDYCQAYDFLRTYFGRPTDAPSPSLGPTISPPADDVRSPLKLLVL